MTSEIIGEHFIDYHGTSGAYFNISVNLEDKDHFSMTVENGHAT